MSAPSRFRGVVIGNRRGAPGALVRYILESFAVTFPAPSLELVLFHPPIGESKSDENCDTLNNTRT